MTMMLHLGSGSLDPTSDVLRAVVFCADVDVDSDDVVVADSDDADSDDVDSSCCDDAEFECCDDSTST